MKCLMEDMEFTFELDADGKFHTNDTELFDPLRLAVALYSKHLSVPSLDGMIEERTVNHLNQTHALIEYDGEYSPVPEKERI